MCVEIGKSIAGKIKEGNKRMETGQPGLMWTNGGGYRGSAGRLD